MLIGADSSPINILVRIECVDVLPQLFGIVLIPPEVRDELSDPTTPEHVRAPLSIQHIPPLDLGEEAAISLAREVQADALLIDEKDGRRAAVSLGLAVIGTLGVLELASERRVIDLPQVVERMKATDFRVDRSHLEAALDRHRRGELGESGRA